MKIGKLIWTALLVTVTASLLSACVVETRPWRGVHYRPVVVVRR